MRNLKKILALVLALVMSLSLMAVASADDELNLGDVSDVYAESVDVLTGLKVFMGNKGEFLPKDNITRAEVAAIIYRIVTGDVTNSQNSIYADYNKFSDVTSDAWYAGYVNYCANAEYVKGVGYDANGKAMFKPQQNVTGYEALAMILRAIGYDRNNEFTGPSWQIQTAATARNRGILVNIQEGTLGTAATREAVAEILCKTILVPVADYSLAFGYRTTDANGKDNETLAYKTFKMEKIEGVVLANEYAALDNTSPLPATQTKLELADNTTKTLNVASTLDDIGESRYVYVIPQAGSNRFDLVTSKTYDTGDNQVYDSGDAVSTVGDSTGKDNGITSIQGAEHYRNYEPLVRDTSDWRIEYVIRVNQSQYDAYSMYYTNGTATNSNLKALVNLSENTPATADGTITYPTATQYNSRDNDPATTGWSRVITAGASASNPAYEYRKVITAGSEITATDRANIQTIFAQANHLNSNINPYDIGEVYVGTSTRPNTDDISNGISYNEFVAKYLNEDELRTVGSNGLGNRLKIVDNDNDGIAEYVLQTVYTIGMVSSIGSDGKINLDITNANFADDTTCHSAASAGHWVAPNDHRVDTVNHVTASTKTANDGEGELAAGNVVLYAVIDGTARIELAETETVKMNTVDRVNRTATPVDGEAIKESAVHEHSATLTHGVNGLVGGTSYTIFKDKYGNLAAYTEGANGEFTLLTDGWFNNQKAGGEYAVRAWIDGSIQTVDITSGGPLFIYDQRTNGGQNNAWGQLRTIGNNAIRAGYRLNNQGNNVTTAVAVLDNGVLTPVDKAYIYSRTIRMIDMKDNAIPGRDNTTASRGWVYDTNYLNTSYTTAYNQATADAANTDGTCDVRALSTTTYYYVYTYKSVYGTGEVINTVVREYTGYAAAPAVNHSEVEDVYVVGTRATNANNVPYYTADVVVVEMSASYAMRDSEQVFIPGFTVANDSLHYEDVDLIRGNGTRETVKIDLWKSTIRGYDPVNGISTGGLYFMDESDTEKGVYIVQYMTPDQVRQSGRYAIGYINKDYAPSSVDWDSIDLMTWDSVGANAPATAGETAKKNVPDKSNYYTLGYNNNINAPILTTSIQSTVMDQNPDRSVRNDPTTGWINETNQGINAQLNEVLVAYDSSNEILYAISFREYTAPATYTHDTLAQQMWRQCMPASYTVTTDAPQVTFGDRTAPGAEGQVITITTTYEGFRTALDKLTVKYGSVSSLYDAAGNKINVGDMTLAVGGTNYTLTVTGTDGRIFNFNLVQLAQAAVPGAFYSKNLAKVEITDSDPADNIIDGIAIQDAQLMRYSEFKSLIEAANAGDTVDVKATNAGVELLNDEFMDHADTIEITVTNRDGNSRTYTCTSITDGVAGTYYTVAAKGGVKVYDANNREVLVAKTGDVLTLTAPSDAIGGTFVVTAVPSSKTIDTQPGAATVNSGVATSTWTVEDENVEITFVPRADSTYPITVTGNADVAVVGNNLVNIGAALPTVNLEYTGDIAKPVILLKGVTVKGSDRTAYANIAYTGLAAGVDAQITFSGSWTMDGPMEIQVEVKDADTYTDEVAGQTPDKRDEYTNAYAHAGIVIAPSAANANNIEISVSKAKFVSDFLQNAAYGSDVGTLTSSTGSYGSELFAGVTFNAPVNAASVRYVINGPVLANSPLCVKNTGAPPLDKFKTEGVHFYVGICDITGSSAADYAVTSWSDAGLQATIQLQFYSDAAGTQAIGAVQEYTITLNYVA